MLSGETTVHWHLFMKIYIQHISLLHDLALQNGYGFMRLIWLWYKDGIRTVFQSSSQYWFAGYNATPNIATTIVDEIKCIWTHSCSSLVIKRLMCTCHIIVVHGSQRYKLIVKSKKFGALHWNSNKLIIFVLVIKEKMGHVVRATLLELMPWHVVMRKVSATNGIYGWLIFKWGPMNDSKTGH